MSWTNNTDMMNISDLSKKLKEEGQLPVQSTEVYAPIKAYGFSTPVEFQEELKAMWEKLDKPQMSKLIPVCTVATFKNRGKAGDLEQEVSFFNYEF